MNFQWNHSIFLFAGVLVLPYLFLRWKFLFWQPVAYGPLQLKRPRKKRISPYYLQLIVEAALFVCILLALAGPYRLAERNLVLDRGIDIILSIDVSASMQAADFPPNRLQFVKKISSDFIRKNTTNRMGVYIFARDTFTQTPLTTDHKILLDLIDGINFDIIDHRKSGGTAIGDALLAATDTLVKNKKENRDQVIILITDGENTHGVDPILAAHYVRSKNIRLYLIGVAGNEPVEVSVDGEPYITPSGKVLTTSLDDSQLKTIAREGGGKYYRAKDSAVFQQIFQQLWQLEQTPIEVKKLTNKIAYSYILAWLSLPLFLLWLILEGWFTRRPMR